jgi:hypothetical protein
MATGGRGALLCLMTAIGEGAAATVLGFRPANVDSLDFLPMALAELTGAFTTIEDDLVFTPGEGPQALRLPIPSRRPFLSGSLLRLRNGDVGVGYATRIGGELMLVSLSSGERAEGYELVYERWSLFLRRGRAETLVGSFRPPSAMSARR